jgi:hypothetical protein
VTDTAFPTQEEKLMQSIREKWRAEIDRAIAATAIPSEFLAALIANETGGDPTKKRFEKNVLLELWEVLIGRSAHFGSIGRDDLESIAVSAAASDASSNLWFPVSCKAIDALATSWGLTQIMGYETIALGVPLFALQQPSSSLQLTCRMLADFAKGKKIDLKLAGVTGGLSGECSSELFDCWNTGRPHAPTADPLYIPNGLVRMAIYRDLGEEPPPQAISA